LRLQTCERRTAKEKSRTSSQGIHWEDVLPQVHLTRAVLCGCTASRHTTPTADTADIWEKLVALRAAAFATWNLENRSVNTGSQFH
jgi:hypothetical protein